VTTNTNWWICPECYQEFSSNFGVYELCPVCREIECPGCGSHRLCLRAKPNDDQTFWYCPECGDWDTEDLIQALKETEAIDPLEEDNQYD